MTINRQILTELMEGVLMYQIENSGDYATKIKVHGIIYNKSKNSRSIAIKNPNIFLGYYHSSHFAQTTKKYFVVITHDFSYKRLKYYFLNNKDSLIVKNLHAIIKFKFLTLNIYKKKKEYTLMCVYLVTRTQR